MTRRKRIWMPHMYHHVMLRGIGGIPLFVDNQDRSLFCLRLQEATETYLHKVHAFCFMTNHVHLILKPTSHYKSLADCVHAFAFRYAQYFNKRYQRQGYLYQDRFRSILVEDGAYLKRLTRYVHLNPVEAGLVNTPEKYIWSSHNAYFGRSSFVWLETDSILSHFGRNRTIALTSLANFTTQSTEATADFEALEKAFQTGIFGSEEFTQKFSPEISKIPDKTTIKTCATLDDLLNFVCQHYQITIEELRSASKTTNLVNGRSILAYASRHVPGGSISEVGRILAKNPGTVSKLAKRVETTPSLQDVVDKLLEKDI